MAAWPCPRVRPSSQACQHAGRADRIRKRRALARRRAPCALRRGGCPWTMHVQDRAGRVGIVRTLLALARSGSATGLVLGAAAVLLLALAPVDAVRRRHA